MGKQINVLDKRTNNNQSFDTGDFVICINCKKTMLVDTGCCICPECKKDNLVWADSDDQEINDTYFNDNIKFKLVTIE